MTTLLLASSENLWSSAYAQDTPGDTPPSGPAATATPSIRKITPYFSVEDISLGDGARLSRAIINSPPHPPAGYETEGAASVMSLAGAVILPDFPSYNWVFGCSAVSGAMVSAYYDRGVYPDMYTGPTNGGLMPISDTSWPTWSDGTRLFPNNPLIASHKGVDGRAVKGSIDDYWVSHASTSLDPYLSGGWTQHTWGSAIGDYMKTSQSYYDNIDGSTSFYFYPTSNEKLTCSQMEYYEIADLDGTYGRKLFYEARGYAVTDCYSQSTDNWAAGGFSLANFRAEIDAGHPVLLNLIGHSVVGYGYDGSTIYIRDTWSSNPAYRPIMTWGGSYEGMTLFSVSVVHLDPESANESPYFTSTPVTTATQDVHYTYAVSAEDPDPGDTLAISAQTKPAWLTLLDNGDGTAVLSGTPGNEQVGDHPVELAVTDHGGFTDTQTFSVTVANINDAPAFTSTPVTTASQDVPYAYNLSVEDPDPGDALTITASTKPDWLTLLDNGDGTAVLSGTPDSTQVGDHSVELVVTDLEGLSETQDFVLWVDDNVWHFIYLSSIMNETP